MQLNHAQGIDLCCKCEFCPMPVSKACCWDPLPLLVGHLQEHVSFLYPQCQVVRGLIATSSWDLLQLKKCLSLQEFHKAYLHLCW